MSSKYKPVDIAKQQLNCIPHSVLTEKLCWLCYYRQLMIPRIPKHVNTTIFLATETKNFLKYFETFTRFSSTNKVH